MCGHVSNPLLVLPLQPSVATDFPPRPTEPEPSSKLVGAGYQSFEDSVLKKLQKVNCLINPSMKLHLLCHKLTLVFEDHILSLLATGVLSYSMTDTFFW